MILERENLLELLDTNQYKELEVIINEDDNRDPFIEFINAHIHENEEYDKFSLFKARQIYENCIKRKDSIAHSFYFFALHLLQNKNDVDQKKAMNILKDGIDIHPNDESILYLLLTLLTPKERSDFVLTKVELKGFNSSRRILPFLVLHCFNNRDISLFERLVELNLLEDYKKNEEYERALLIGYLFYIYKDFYKAKEYFMHVASYSKKLFKSYALLGNVLVSEEKDLELAIEKLPMVFEFEPMFYDLDGNSYIISLENFLEELFNDILTREVIKDKDRLIAKIKGIRGYRKFDMNESGGIADLKFATKHFTYKDYFYAIHMFYFSKGKYKEAYKYGIEYYYLAAPEERMKQWCCFVIPNNKKDLLDLIKMIKSSEYRFYDSKKEFFQHILSPVIKELHSQKEYELVCELIKPYEFQHVVEVVGFEVAYSYEECDDHELSKKYYEYLVNDSKLVSAESLNNLAIIYSEESNFEHAIELRKRALEKSEGDAKYKKRLDEEIENYTSYKNMMKEDLESVDSLMDENGWVLNILNNFYEHIDDNGFIECSYRLLPKYLHLNKIKADEMIHYFIDKKYVRKSSSNEHKIDTQSTVYKVNMEVYISLKEIIDKEMVFNDLSVYWNDFTPNKLRELGNVNTLFSKVQLLHDINFREMINRDLRENLIALLTKSYKSSLVISGSIIEAVIMYKLSQNNIEKYKFTFKDGNEKTIKVKEMLLSQLITVAEHHKVISHEALKHSDAIRGYRNLIHPGVEIRKSRDTPAITEDNVLLAWMVVKKVLNEL